ncbi:NAD+ synthase [Methanomicrobium mobile]|uniref:NAD+ synthase n=1 Tax=Methanomicrobium mobile TaxID=2205 RepID=UPI0005B2DE97|nr:NAD+ synthase [Methanomicrobium mobile]
MKELCEGCECEKIEQMIRHTVWSSGRNKIIIGLSGGIDSALAAVLCTRAVGAENVLGYMLPSAVTPKEDIDDVKALCEKFGIRLAIVPITGLIGEFSKIEGFTEDNYLLGNVMARLRMTILYYYANQNQGLVCGTSNKSEYLLGYSTKHGDDAGDIEPLMHLYKTEVRILSAFTGVIQPIIDKTPSAGLYSGQSDEKEIGFTYAVIDEALRNLEANNWKPQNDTESAILEKVKKAAHKRNAPPNLLKDGGMNGGCRI